MAESNGLPSKTPPPVKSLDMETTTITPAVAVAATTISTIAVQSGATRIVIALLKVCDQLELRVLECTPPLTRLGATLDEAERMRDAHLDVLQKIQNKQSPVEELLRKADQLIAAQKTRAEVYTAMADSLSIAWKDINDRLDQRKNILNLNVAFQRRVEECQGILLTLQLACTSANSNLARKLETEAECAGEVDSLRHEISHLHDLRRASLESLMAALSDGKSLLESLQEMANAGSLDSRPDTGAAEVTYAISQVEQWLEDLHDRRRVLELTFTSCRTRLEQRLALAMVEAECARLETETDSWREQLAKNMHKLGDSSVATLRLAEDHAQSQQRLKELQDHSLKMTKAAEQLVVSGAPGGSSTVARTFALLSSTNECIQLFEERGALLQRTSKFFADANDVISKLSHLWSQLTTVPMPLASAQTVSLHSRAELVVREVSDRLIDEGRSILQEVGEHKPGVEGVKRVVNELEDWRTRIEKECVAHKEENLKISQSLNNFLDKQNHLYNWLVNYAETFLQSHRDMNTALAPAREFQDQHLLLAADLQAKGSEINALLLTLPPILDLLNDADRRNVDEKVDALHTHWLNLKAIVEGRLLLVAPYVKVHTMAAQLANEMDDFEETMKLRVGRPDREKELDQAWTGIQQKFTQLKHVGQNVCADAAKVDDPYLDVKKAIDCVETLLEHLSKRRFNVSETWQEWQHSVITEKEIHEKWERNIMESSRTVDWVSKLDSQLYPILPEECGSANSIKSHIEAKLKTVLPEIKKAQEEVEDHLRTADSLLAKGEGGEHGQAISDKLRELQHQLQELGSDYQVLLHLLVAYFTSISELEKTIDELKSPPDAQDGSGEGRLKDLDASYQAIAELLKFAQTESEQIIVKIKQQEPEAAGKHDIERLRKLLADKQADLDSIYSRKSSELKQNEQKNAFSRDLAQINYAIADLGRQSEAIRGQYGEDVSSAKATSAAFDYFEKTIQLLEQRIETFITTTRQVPPSDNLEEEANKAKDLEELQKTWKEFREKVAENRRLIELSIQYFQLVEEATEWFKEGSNLLTSITRRSTAVRFPESANMLLQEMDMFLKPGEAKQDERIDKITQLGKEIYGDVPAPFQTTVAQENSEMIQQFTAIKEELVVLAKVLSQAEAEKSAEESDSAKPDDKLEVPVKLVDTSDVELSETTTTTTTTTTRFIGSNGKQMIEKVETTTSSKEGEPTVTVSETSQREVAASPQAEASPLITEITSESEEEVAIAPEFVQKLIGASIEEGEKFRFECRVSGVPPPKIIWEKDGMSIENNPDYVTSQENGVCTLTIEETFTEDSAKFTCRAINSAGKAETSATLSVNEVEPEQELSPPSFIVGLPTANASEGTAHTLECLVKGEPLPTVQWFKDGAAVEDSSERSVSFNNGTARLRIEEVSLDDQGEYSCKATNSEGTAVSTARLGVEPVKPVEAPNFLAPLSNVMARAGQKIKLECSVKGIPSPTVMWTQDGKPIKETRDLKTQFDDGRATLVITEAFPKDAGTYVVTARNSAGEAFTSCTVTVKGRLPTETSDSELASDMEPTKPSIQLALKDSTAKEGEKVRLDCIIVGQPEPEVIWYHEGRPVKESADFQLLFQGDRCSLVLREVYLEDAGGYKVVAINSAGEASSECVLSVEGAGESEPPSRPSTGVAELAETTDKSETEPEKSEIERSATDRSDTEAEKTDTEKFLEEERKAEVIIPVKVEEAAKPAAEEPTPPRFTKLLADLLVAEGDGILLECTLEGHPKPSVRWTLNNNDVISSEHVKLEEDNGVVRLRIGSASPDDRGVYTARATNLLGEAKCFANLIVKSALADSRSVELADRLVGPDFKERFVSQSVPVGTTTKFECIVTGRPVPKVRWFFNDEPVSGKNFLVSKSGERDVLSIPEVTPENIGRVSCIAENEAGKATCSATLAVVDSLAVDTMSQPGGGEATTTTVDDQSSGTFSMKRAVFMQSSSSTSTTTTQTGFGPPKTESHSISSMKEHELKKEGSKPPHEVLVERKEEVHKVGEQPAEVIKEGSLVISSDGEKRKEAYSSSSNVAAQPKISGRKSTAPRFVTPLNGKIVDQGADILLEGIIDGYPTPTIEWTKNGQDIRTLPEAARITTSWELNRVRLQMGDVTVKDAGRYSCKATNPVGTATSTADIVVKKTIFPPVFGRRLLVSHCRQGERVTLEVEVTGLPEPTVTWSKDGLPLSSFPHLEIRQRAQGNSYAIIIEKATPGHSGRYMVRATNAGGEAHCIQDLAVLDALPEELQDKASQDRIFQELMDFPSLQKLQSSVSSVKMTKDISSGLSPSLTTPVSATGESLHVSETSKTEKHFSIKVDGTPSPLFRPTGETQSKVTTTKFSLGPEPRETTIPIQRESSIATTTEKKSPLDSFSILPKVSDLTYETVSKQVSKEETATSKSIHTKIEEQKHFSSSGSTKMTEVITEKGTEESQNEAIDSSSIPTQTALQFFMSKIQEQKEPAPPKPAEQKESVPVQQKVTEKINIFEHYEPRVESADESTQPKEEVPVHPKVTEKISIFENYESKPEVRDSSSKVEETSWKSTKEGSAFPSFTTKDERFSQVKSEVQHTRTVHQETRNWSGTYSVPSKPAASTTPAPLWTPSKPLYFSEESASSVFEKHIAPPSETAISLQQEFGLQPEPPPEMCYTPKAERSAKREGLADRVKNLEDSQKQLDPLHIPKGAVRILPVSIGTPQTPKTAQPSFLYPAQKEVREEEVKREVREEHVKTTAPPVEETKVKKNAETVGGGAWTTRAAVAVEGPPLPNQSMSTFSSSSYKESSWSTHGSETYTKSGGILRPPAQDVVPRPTSPRPSAEAVSMEKLWTSQRTTSESESIPFPHEVPLQSGFESKTSSFSKYERTSKAPSSPSPSFGGLASERTRASQRLAAPMSIERPVSPRPSSEGLAMDKMWAHKKTSSVKKVWPPPQPTEERIITPWTNQYSSTEESGTRETISVQKNETTVQEEKTFTPEPLKPFTPVETPKPQGFRPVVAPYRKTEFKPGYSFKPETPPPVQNNYVSASDVSHKSSMEQLSSQFSKTYEICKTEQSESSWNGTPIPRDISPPVVEERHIRPSEAKRIWPPNKPDYELQAPKMVRKVQRPETHFKPVVAQLPCSEPVPGLEPGPPPEMGYAAPPPQPRRRSYVEQVEEDLEKNLEKGPSRVVPGGVRIIPPKRDAPKSVVSPAPKEEPFSWKPVQPCKPAEPLEPFPFKPDPQRPKQKVFVPPPPTPSKFVKGEFVSSDYESDLETTRISAKWRPSRSSYSDTETCSFRRVRPPSVTSQPARFTPSQPQPIPPSHFEHPSSYGHKHGMRHENRISSSIAATQAVFTQRSSAPVAPLNLKPGSPPVFCQKKTPESPRSKKYQRVPIATDSGYMADTDEPRTWKPATPKSKSPSSLWSSQSEVQQRFTTDSCSTTRVEQRSTMSQESSFQSMQKISSTEQVAPSPVKPAPPFKIYRHHDNRMDKKIVSSGSAAFRTDQNFITRDRKEFRVQRPASADPPLEPFPFKPDPPRPKRAVGPPPPSPSKFIKGEFRESDYESDYDGRIPAVWRPYDSDTETDRSYRRVRPVLTPVHPRPHVRTPTPPTAFDNPPQFSTPPRPKFEPIEKPLAAVKLDEILQPAMKATPVVRPKPIQGKPIETFLVKSVPKESIRIDIQPGSPPELGFAPPNAKCPAVHETSKSLSFSESTETSRRIVSMQKTTRLYKFGEKQKSRKCQDIILEPLPFQPEPPRSKKRAIGPPPPKPAKFVPGEFRESDYESEVESTRIKAKWGPSDSENDEPHYRRVRPPSVKRCSSVPLQSPVPTPDFSTPYMPPPPPVDTQIYSSLTSYELQEQKRLQRVEEMRRRFEEKKQFESFENQIYRQSKPVRRVSAPSIPDFALVPGSPPEIAFSGKTLSTQTTDVASQHLNQMTHSFKSKAQRFMEDIVTDSRTTSMSKKPEKPILKKQLSAPIQSDSDQQAFREETRVAEYGTKHIDPDTGLIYFKYDFGYEFGIILPGEGKVMTNGKSERRVERSKSKEEGSIDFPVIHEKTGRNLKGFSRTTDDLTKSSQYRSKKSFQNKSVKWEPTSESEVSELELDSIKNHRHSLPQPLPSYHKGPYITIPNSRDFLNSSPSSVSPSLPSLSPYNAGMRAETAAPGSWSQPADTTIYLTPLIQTQPVNANSEELPPRAPCFTTPLRDIAVVNGQTARFECIVQAEPSPNILWAKDGRILEHCQRISIQYRNGVCRLTVLGANSRDAGSYTCTATNRLGTSCCTATLLVPGERRASLGAYRF